MDKQFLIRIVWLGILLCVPVTFTCHRKIGEVQRFNFYYSEFEGLYYVKATPTIDIMDVPAIGCISVSSAALVKSGMKSGQGETKNNDQCIIPYTERDCGGSKLGKPTPGNFTAYHHHPINSFYLCSWKLTISPSWGKPPQHHLDNQTVRLQGRITKFTVVSKLEDLEREDDLHPIHISDHPEYLVNNGTTSVQMAYERKILLNESFHFGNVESFSSLHGIEVLDSLSMEGPLCFPVGATSGCEPTTRMKDVLKDAYQFNYNLRSRKMTAERTRDFSIRKEVKVPACTKLEVTSFIQTKEKVPIEFNLGVRISGRNRGFQMTTDELRTNLPNGMDYLADLNELEIFIKTKGTILATVGVRSLLNITKMAIPGCRINQEPQTASAPSTNLSGLSVMEFLEKYQAYLIPLAVLTVCVVYVALCVRISHDEGLRKKEIELVTVGRYSLAIEFHSPCQKR